MQLLCKSISEVGACRVVHSLSYLLEGAAWQFLFLHRLITFFLLFAVSHPRRTLRKPLQSLDRARTCIYRGIVVGWLSYLEWRIRVCSCPSRSNARTEVSSNPIALAKRGAASTMTPSHHTSFCRLSFPEHVPTLTQPWILSQSSSLTA